jgi:uncharacterized protein (TIGR02145 family)
MKTIQIGSQEWTKKNLRVFKFRNGDIIPIVQDADEWSEMTSAAMCINPNNGECYYNWYAVIDPRGIAPEGFHIPSVDEWNQLIDECDGDGDKLKSNNEWNGNNSTGFDAIASGLVLEDGFIDCEGCYGYWWSSSYNEQNAIGRSLCDKFKHLGNSNYLPQEGLCIRLIKDAQ